MPAKRRAPARRKKRKTRTKAAFDPLPVAPVACPFCRQGFRVPARAETARCPHCRRDLRLEHIAPQNAPRQIRLAERLAGQSGALEAYADCPHCNAEVPLLLGQKEAICPACEGRLRLDAAHEAVGQVLCPFCSKDFEIGLGDDRAACPHCGQNVEVQPA